VALGGIAIYPLVVLGLATTEAAPTPTPTPTPTPIRVALEAPPDCATAESFYQGIRDRTDRVRTAEQGENTVELSVRLVRAGSKVQGELRMSGEHGESDTRRVEGATCDEVLEALSLTAALALDPTARLVTPPAPASPPSAPAPVTPPSSGDKSPLPAYESPPPSAPPRQRFSEFSLSAQALVTALVTPGPSVGGALVGRMAFDPDASGQSVSVGLLHLRNDLFEKPDEARYQLSGFSITGCPVRLRFSRLTTLEPCATTMAGWLTAEAVDVEISTDKVRTYWSLGALLYLRVSAGAGAALELLGGLTAPLTMRHFNVGEPPQPLGQTPVISPILGLGLSWGF
jgi:hypothetical protein